ncbi:tetratricopeptide repeat protein [Spectribacter hydrogenoxidans]|uniref:Tetratricopeptide repeat protein n=1 Tax=Spectribacter hydrogenoxidans TaxID=3075608 RepID=A0ABU3C0C1_9GAMM|nr:tetratricopeptide repeat protein [Salinisphaera sp. W335]MDT0634973.1 tetratricopeptide repeat protein [Salinisphaera sp. W335]
MTVWHSAAFGFCLACAAAPVGAAEALRAAPANELHGAHAQYLQQTGASHEVLIHYQETREAQGLARARSLLAAGLLDRVEQILQTLSDQPPATERTRLWFELARARHQRGAPERALAALDRVVLMIPDDIAGRLGGLRGQLQLAAGQPAEAAATLRRWIEDHDNDLTARYNLGVALVRAGRNQEGAGELNEIGRMDAETASARALRDKANLVLAFGFLELGQGATARGLFKRIRLDGPFSDKALLGLGWSELAPDGEPQDLVLMRRIRCLEDPARLLPDSLPVLRRMPRESCGRPRMFRDSDEFQWEDGGDTAEERYRRALRPWLELAERNADDVAVQEALMATGHAFQQLAANQRAETAYAEALDQLLPRRQATQDLLDRLSTSATIAEPRQSADTDPEARLLQALDIQAAALPVPLADILARPGVQTTIADINDLSMNFDRLDHWQQRVAELEQPVQREVFREVLASDTLPPRLAQRRDRLRAAAQRIQATRSQLIATLKQHADFLRGQTHRILSRRKAFLDAYLAQIRRGRATLFDTAAAGASEGGAP